MHDGLPVKGYNPQSPENVAFVNHNKVLEEKVLRQLDDMKSNPDYDQRWVAVAITNIQIAFMAANRAVFQPSRISGELTE